ncbi:C2H2-type domain-containing protein [Caenorhabditis elegans]|uniref:C2H2-type domain-containing protein n=1 Tax=Caenorhabditis elegans TaxID=6239 RepID=H2L0N7_CAEEL|nr:C2H2-type domain-containing protein [Caenorhabditis elegans]CCD74275.1 C2H2-type domain-containing protein [Caenorhabditis elegans]|eukprot:NP_503139.1 Uncharacterized protein CELE_W03F9.2 [Caenorhabditis elegans]
MTEPSTSGAQDHDDYLVTLSSPQRQCTIRVVQPASALKRKLPTSSVPEFNPDSYGESIPENAPRPVCETCSVAWSTWAAYEFHMLQTHIIYRPFRCSGCRNLNFHTEDEGKHHLEHFHGGKPGSFQLIKQTDFAKENQLIECLENAKTTEQLGISKERLENGLKMIEKLQKIKFKAVKVHLPCCLRHEMISKHTETEKEAPPQEKSVTNAQKPGNPALLSLESRNYDYEQQDTVGI